ncbi:ATP-dependent nuclease [Pseudomonas frederiksbergensis]|uniref:ATP-dependent nuclease n=1 Tax=Pseudomonas frederiksbergensis TaxID=104087 RepID=UPI003D1C07A4
MHLKKIHIDNFKNYRKATIHLDSHLNVFTGVNNAGKTTILEAVALWSECFRILITKAKRSDRQLNIRQGDYRLGNKLGNYIDHRKITSVRTSKYEDIFFGLNLSSPILISVTITGLSGDEELEIPIVIKAANGSNYEIFLDRHDRFDFRKLNTAFQHLPQPFSTIYASPVASLVAGEQFKLLPQISNSVISRQSYLVLRNRISRLKSDANYAEFEKDVSKILTDGALPVTFHVIGDIHKDVSVDINVSFGHSEQSRDISLLGSGTLQIIELMLALYEARTDLNLVLLDEPDSHIHRDIQKRLVQVLTRRSNNAQVFITTHNESLLRSTSPKNIFHIENTGDGVASIEYHPIVNNGSVMRHSGIQPTFHSSVIRMLGNESSLDLLDIIEARKVIFVEGDIDANYIRKIYEKSTGRDAHDMVFWAFGGIDAFLQKIRHYKTFIEGISSSQTIWDKCIAIFDCDYITRGQIDALGAGLQSHINLSSHIWDSYTFESSILSNKQSLAEMLNRAFMAGGGSPSLPDIMAAIDQVFNAKAISKRAALSDDPAFQSSITGQIQSRAGKIENDLGIRGVITGGEARYFINYSTYARAELDARKIHHLCNKDDVEAIISEVEALIGLSLNSAGLPKIDLLIDSYDSTITLNTWEEMVRKLI